MVPESKKIRVMFSKTGALKFISHLDMNRTMKAAFLRSGLPIWYTMGFNPHPKTVFSLPLSVGVSDLCCFMDFKITEEVSHEEICRALNAAFPEGLHALEAYEPQTKLSDIGWSEYEISIEAVGTNTSSEEKIKAVFAAPMVIEKNSKAGIKTVDIAPLCELAECRAEGDRIKLRLLLSSTENEFVNPRFPIECISKALDEIPADADTDICRTAVYLADKKTYFR